MNDAHADLETVCRCGTTVTYEDDYKGMVRQEGWEGKGLRLRCPDCGTNHTVCPICHGGGWYRGESTGNMLACHCCNPSEAARQMRRERGL
jgi:hypothetical protein